MKSFSSIIAIFVWLLFLLGSITAQANIPVTSDSRIKTFVFNENDIFRLTVHYGYMTSIEFSKDEEITTIAPGNSHSWKFIKEGRRLFIKSLEGAAHTNVTIITTKRTYHFEIESKDPDGHLDEQLVYVVRFFYPDTFLDRPRPRINTKQFVKAPVISAPRNNFNFDYTLSGPDSIAPIKVFDDGNATFMQFANNNEIIPHFFTITADQKEKRASYLREGEFIVISAIAPKLILRLGNDQVDVYNEKLQ